MNWPFGNLRPGAYGAIIADPPWRFMTWGAAGNSKGPSAHYEVMDFASIAALPVADLAARDCMLFMWGVQAMPKQAIALMEAWEFEVKSSGSWAKQSKTGKRWAFGTGYIFRSASEPYLVGTRGKPKQAVKNVRNLIVAPVREHSRKPDQMHEDVERMFPDVERCELFARQRRRGWDAWGNDIDHFEERFAA